MCVDTPDRVSIGRLSRDCTGMTCPGPYIICSPPYLDEVGWWWVVVSAVWTDKSINWTHPVSWSTTLWVGYNNESVISQTIKSPTGHKNEGMIAFDNIEY